MILALHVRRRRHRRLMDQAKYHSDLSVWFRKDDATRRWDQLDHAMGALTRCGCPRSVWPESVQQLILSTGKGEK